MARRHLRRDIAMKGASLKGFDEVDFQERTWRSRDGLELFTRDYPGADGPAKLPIVCVPGLTRNSADFEDVAPVLAATGRRTLVVDLRGRGRSEWSVEAAYSVPLYNTDLLGLCNAAGIGRAVFLGTSMGGMITAALAGVAPDLVSAAIINDVGPVVGDKGGARTNAEIEQVVSPKNWEAAAEFARLANSHAHPALSQAEWLRYGRRLFRQRSDGQLVLDFDPAIGPALAEETRTAGDLWPVFEELARGRPVLLIHGVLSDILERSTVEEFRKRAPTLQVAEILGVGHSPLLSEPDAEEAIHLFLHSVD